MADPVGFGHNDRNRRTIRKNLTDLTWHVYFCAVSGSHCAAVNGVLLAMGFELDPRCNVMIAAVERAVAIPIFATVHTQVISAHVLIEKRTDDFVAHEVNRFSG